MVEIPEGVKFYLGDRVSRSAVDAVLSLNKVSNDFSIEDLEEYEAARFAARRVQFEYWQLLRDAWKATWGGAIAAQWPRVEGATVQGCRSVPGCRDDDFSATLESAWNEDETYGVHRLSDGHVLLTMAGLSNTLDALTLGWCLLDGAGAVATDGIDVPAAWEFDEEDEWYRLEQGAAKLDLVAGAVDLSGLSQLAKDCVFRIDGALSA